MNVLLIGLPVLMLGHRSIGLVARSGRYGTIDDGSVPPAARRPGAVVARWSAGASLLASRCSTSSGDRGRTTSRRSHATWEVRLFLLAAPALRPARRGPVARRRGPPTWARTTRRPAAWATRIGSRAAPRCRARRRRGRARPRARCKDQQKAITAVQTRLGKFAEAVRDGLVALVVMLAGPILLLAIAVLGVLDRGGRADSRAVVFGARPFSCSSRCGSPSISRPSRCIRSTAASSPPRSRCGACGSTRDGDERRRARRRERRSGTPRARGRQAATVRDDRRALEVAHRARRLVRRAGRC